MKKLILVFFLTLLNVYANIGKITFVNGTANVLREEKSFLAKLGDDILSKDIISTEENSKLQIIFNDKTVVTIGNKSKFLIDDYYYNETNLKESKLSMNFSNGFFKTITGKIGKINPSKFKLKTKSASIGIRGTQITMTSDAVAGDFIACTSGEISVTSNLTGSSVIVPSGNFTKLKPGLNPDKPKSYSKEQLNELSTSTKETEKVAVSEIENKTNPDTTTNTDSIQANVLNTNKIDDSVKTTIATEKIVAEEKASALLVEKNQAQIDSTSVAAAQAIIDAEVLADASALALQAISSTKQVKYDAYYLKMGYWLNPLTNEEIGTYIEGDRTSASKIQEYRKNNITAQYNGAINAIHTNTEGTNTAVGGSANFNVDFGNKKIDGTFVIGSTDWKVKITDISLNGNGGFSTNNIENNGSSTSGITGTIDGKFYGPNVEHIGGSIDMNSTNNGSVKGSYATSK